VIGVAWSPGETLLGAIGDGKKIAVWRGGAWAEPAASWEIGNDYQSALAFHPTRPLLAVGNRDGHVRIYGVAEAQLAKPPLLVDRDVGGMVSAVAFSPDGATLLVSAGPPAKQITRFSVGG
jgi:WD40 repeat protein